MFMLMFTSTYDRIVANAQAKICKLEDAFSAEVQRANRIAGRLASVTRERDAAINDLDAAINELGYAQEALRDIAGMETEHCAHIGKRMAARAQQGLDAPSALHGAPVLKAVG